MTINEINEVVQTVCNQFKWDVWTMWNSKLKNNRSSLKYCRNGFRLSEELKSSILSSLAEKFKGDQSIENIKWSIGEHHYGDYDYLRIIKKS